MQMIDLQNLVILARDGLKAKAEGLSAQEGVAAYTAIGRAEAVLGKAKADAEAQQEESEGENDDGSTSKVHYVEVGESEPEEATEDDVEESE
jgi:hypothetical protein